LTGSGLAYTDGQLELDGVVLAQLAERIPTPFFVFSEALLRANVAALASGLSAAGVEGRLRYCAKTNHEAGVLRVLATTGCELLASHAVEVELALRCGFAAERIALQRPVLERDELERAVALGIGFVHVNRLDELDLLESVAGAAGRTLRLSLRLRPPGGLSALGTLQRRIGFDPEPARAAAERIRRSSRLRLAAVNLYVGTQHTEPREFAAALRHALRVVGTLGNGRPEPVEEINLGGGVPSPTLSRLGPFKLWRRWRDLDERPSREDGLAGYLADVGKRYAALARAAGFTKPPALAAEPGRAVVGGAAVVVSRVRAVDGNWLYLDASRTFLPESPLQFRRRILPLADRRALPRRRVHLSGPTLNSLDVIDLARRLPPLDCGDLVALGDAGAYTISRASRYAGLGPEVWMIELGGRVRRIRRAEGLADLVAPMLAHDEVAPTLER
jgi:diaminopimelate decarboxylase